jgi:uncharacterized OB-fold protein
MTIDTSPETHALVRTSPKGQRFIGRCIKCGASDLPMSAACDECPNPKGMSQDDALIEAILGGKPDA